MRRLIPLLLFCALSTASVGAAWPLAALQTPVPGGAVFVVSGRGYGHGVGMSQYGAFGMASAGYSYDKILAHYYVGTQLGHVSNRAMRVLLAQGRQAVTISSTAPFTVVDATGTAARLPAGPLVLKPNLVVATPTGPMTAVSPVLFRPGKASVALDGRPYRGRLEVALDGAYLRVVNVVHLESYVQAVVAGEMPDTWPAAALQAQAVAARSYALAGLLKGKPFDLYSDERSQVYPGVSGEKPHATAAATATAGQVVLYEGKVARTTYFSSSGGKTASAADVFGVAIPYLVSQPDPWDKASPYYRWGPILFGAKALQDKLGLSSRVLDATGVPTPSGRLRTVTLQTVAGTTAVPSSLLRTALGLRSTWITIGVLRLDRPAASPVYGTSVRLTGIARDVVSSQLSSSTDGDAWTPAASLARGTAGAVSALVKPSQTTQYRLQSTQAASPALLLTVSPRVRLLQPTSLGELAGTVRPRLAGAKVTIQMRDGSVWSRVGDAVVDKTGAFSAEFEVLPGSYRALVDATGGYAKGISPILAVSG